MHSRWLILDRGKRLQHPTPLWLPLCIHFTRKCTAAMGCLRLALRCLAYEPEFGPTECARKVAPAHRSRLMAHGSQPGWQMRARELPDS